jgi:Uma2 family endonuclease
MTLADHQRPTIPSRRGDPCWEIAEVFPQQGDWLEQEYLSLRNNRRIEFNDGMIEVLPVPSIVHQLVLAWFVKLLDAFVERRGKVLVSGYKLRVDSRLAKHRDPDVMYLTHEQLRRAGEQFSETAEVVAEIVSPDDPDRDYVTKRAEYATAGVAEYWILDPTAQRILVLGLEGGVYVQRGHYGAGERAASQHLPGFAVAVNDMIAETRLVGEHDEA